VHSSGDHGDQEPWSFGTEITDIVRKFIEIRYQLMPYLYTMFYKYSKEQKPMLQALVLFDQEDTQTHFRTDEFIFGEQILVCPIQEPNSQGRRMYIPRGEWYDYWTDETVTGGKEKWVSAELDKLPIYIKEGAIIPKYPIQQYIGEVEIEELILDTYFKLGIETSEVYEDAQDGYDYKKGRFSLRNFKLTGKEKSLTIQQFKDGSYVTEYEILKFNFHGLPFKIGKIQVDNEEISLKSVRPNGDNSLHIDKNFTVLHIMAK
ncbi:MAG: TIM-barrel domain-containing protein, partial [Maribacter sp.]